MSAAADTPTSPAAKPRRPRSALFWVIVISAGVHVLAGVIFASWRIYRYTAPPEATFTSPPPPARVPPADMAYRVQMQQLQRQSRRPPDRISGQSDSLLNRSLDQLDSPGGAFGTSALAGTPVVAGAGGSGRGMGRIGGGSGGGLGFGVSAVDFFGIKKQGERVAFIVDAGRSMVEPERGDLPGYDRVKQELVGMIEGLSPGTFFNIIVFERGIDVYAPQMVVATADNTAQVADWIGPYWRLKDGKIEKRGSYRKNHQPQMIDWNGAGGTSRLDLALATALQMRADLIFLITDGSPSVRKGRSEASEAMHKQRLELYNERRARYEASDRGKREMAIYEEQRAAARAEREKINAERAARGLPPVVREGGRRTTYKKPGPKRPSRPTEYYSLEEITRYFRRQARILYEGFGGEVPSLNVVGYSPDQDDVAVIEDLAEMFPDGSSRIIGAYDASVTY